MPVSYHYHMLHFLNNTLNAPYNVVRPSGYRIGCVLYQLCSDQTNSIKVLPQSLLFNDLILHLIIWPSCGQVYVWNNDELTLYFLQTEVLIILYIVNRCLVCVGLLQYLSFGYFYGYHNEYIPPFVLVSYTSHPGIILLSIRPVQF